MEEIKNTQTENNENKPNIIDQVPGFEPPVGLGSDVENFNIPNRADEHLSQAELDLARTATLAAMKAGEARGEVRSGRHEIEVEVQERDAENVAVNGRFNNGIVPIAREDVTSQMRDRAQVINIVQERDEINTTDVRS